MPQIAVSYGILHYNPTDDVRAEEAFTRTVRTLANNAELPHEVFIIDQGNPNTDNGRDLAYQFGWNFISLKENVGISRGINLLANMARGQYISLVTSDVEFTKGLDQALIQTLKDNPDIWQICPASDNSDIIYQRRGYQPTGIVRTLAQELTIQFWPRKTFEKIGYFDERWKACYENLDYALRIFLAGGFAAISHDTFCPHDFHMSMRSGAREHSYDGYINMSNGFDQTPLAALWNQKWPGINQYINLYEPLFGMGLDGVRNIINQRFKGNMYLPYVQKVGY